MAFEYTPYLDELSVELERYCWELSDNDEEMFTNYAFIRRVLKEHKSAYIRFLHAMLQDRGDDAPFNLTHQAIGRRLSIEAKKLHYKQNKKPDVEDFDIFGTFKTDGVVTYTRTEKVKRPT